MAKTFKQRMAERMCPKCHGPLAQDRDGLIHCAGGTHARTDSTSGLALRWFPLRNQPPTVTVRIEHYLIANLDAATRSDTETLIQRVMRRQLAKVRQELRAAGLQMRVRA